MKKYSLQINIEGNGDEIIEKLADIATEISYTSEFEPLTRERILNTFGGKGWDIEEIEEDINNS